MDSNYIGDILEKKQFPSRIVEAFRKVKRELFVPEHLRNYAYEDIALPLDEGSTTSQPSTIAFMLELLNVQENQKILEIGSGSGFVLALIAEIVKSGEFYGIELNKKLAIESKKRLTDSRIHIFNRNGFHGLEEKAPFDRILVSASADEKPLHLLSQLSNQGIIVSAYKDHIISLKKIDGAVEEKSYPGFSFVPLLDDKELK